MKTQQAPEFKVAKTIKLGVGPKNGREFQGALKAKGIQIYSWVPDILQERDWEVAKEETEIDLYFASTGELGFEHKPTREKVYQRVEELGYDKCPYEAVPQLVLQWDNQPLGSYYNFVTGPICVQGVDGPGTLILTTSHHTGCSRSLGCHYETDKDRWYEDVIWIFVKRKKKAD
ncbi:MAG: hypothetical protein EXS52_02360 [Candidatus Staskawiczbacteria bacterium]|nr:hypothetical protein [Candidatus Staskawiczbacteria bacterium]